MDTTIGNLVTTIADRLFLPVNVEYSDFFTKPLRYLILVFFLYSIIIAFPPVVETIKFRSTPLPLISSIVEDPVFWKKWLPFINFLVEIVFFLMIGGSVFSEWVVTQSKTAIQRYETAMDIARKKAVVDKKDELAKELKSYYDLIDGICLSNFLKKLWLLYRGANRVTKILSEDVAKVNTRFLIAKITVSFPGGTYGLFAFILFAILVQIKVGQLYLG